MCLLQFVDSCLKKKIVNIYLCLKLFYSAYLFCKLSLIFVVATIFNLCRNKMHSRSIQYRSRREVARLESGTNITAATYNILIIIKYYINI